MPLLHPPHAQPGTALPLLPKEELCWQGMPRVTQMWSLSSVWPGAAPVGLGSIGEIQAGPLKEGSQLPGMPAMFLPATKRL